MTRKIIVHIAMSADGYIARRDGDIDWLSRRPAPEGFYGVPEFARSTDAKILGRKTFDLAVSMGAPFRADDRHYVFSRHPPAAAPPGVRFVTEPVGAFVERLRGEPGKHIWLMGGGGIIASFLDAGAIDEFVVSVVPTFIGDGIPLISPGRRDVPLQLRASKAFPDGVVQLHYDVTAASAAAPRRGGRPSSSRASSASRGSRSRAAGGRRP